MCPEQHVSGSGLHSRRSENGKWSSKASSKIVSPVDRAEVAPMRFGYLDPPYYGCCGLYGHRHEPPYGCWDDIETHRQLIEWANAEFRDGWAMSASVPSLRYLLPHTSPDTRIGSWVKSFSAFKKGVRPAYAWEPVIFRGGRNPNNGHPHAPPPKDGKQNTPKDFFITEADVWEVIVCPITLRKGLTGAKPEAFCRWVLDLLNVQPGDELVDLFTGTGVMGRVFAERSAA